MTKEEAINAVHKAHHPDDLPGCLKWDVNRSWAEKAVNGYIALGLLKIDEPKTAAVRLLEALQEGEWQSPEQLVSLLAHRGIWIGAHPH